MLKAVVFDLDGTLIDSTEAIVNSFVHSFNHVGDPVPSREEILKYISVPLEKHFAELTDRDPIEMSGIYREHYFDTCTVGTNLLPGVRASLGKLLDEDLRLAIATSKSSRGSEIILDDLGVDHFFEFIVGADSVQNHKPHPEALSRSLEKLGIAPGEMVYVGDTKYDTEAAKAAGVACVAVATGYAPREELEALAPQYVADSLTEAVDHILHNLRQFWDIY